jgi:hypothetical protein
MRKELEEAKSKVLQMEHVVRLAERNLEVSRHDQKGLSASVASHVAKLDKLLGLAKSMRQDRAEQKLNITAARHRQQHRVKVSQCCVPQLVFI